MLKRKGDNGEVTLRILKGDKVSLTMSDAEARELYDVLHHANKAYGSYSVLSDKYGTYGTVVASKVHDTVTLTLPLTEARALLVVLENADDAYETYCVLGDVL